MCVRCVGSVRRVRRRVLLSAFALWRTEQLRTRFERSGRVRRDRAAKHSVLALLRGRAALRKHKAAVAALLPRAARPPARRLLAVALGLWRRALGDRFAGEQRAHRTAVAALLRVRARHALALWKRTVTRPIIHAPSRATCHACADCCLLPAACTVCRTRREAPSGRADGPVRCGRRETACTAVVDGAAAAQPVGRPQVCCAACTARPPPKAHAVRRLAQSQ